jgi:predicted dehydrogenase
MASKQDPVRVGVIGCGNISDIYLQNCGVFQALEAFACADLLPARAQAKAEKWNVSACTVEELLANPAIGMVINLTIPNAHAAVSLAALAAGKHVYSEKPLAVTREDGRRILDLAQEKGLRVGCAPDTFLGGGLQTCRKLIDDGAIGVPLGATAFMAGRGPEGWHPDPEFFYKAGGGPMFDMGPYYLTALVSLLGPVHRVTGSARISFPERVIGSQPHYGERIVVETPTHLAGVLDFASGPVGMLLTSFDVWAANLPRIEIYGSDGTLSVPDPNTFRGPVRLWKGRSKEWVEVPLTHGYAENSRGLGTADMAQAIRDGRSHRSSGNLAFHVLDIMHAIHDASREGRHIELSSGVERPAALPVGLEQGLVD